MVNICEVCQAEFSTKAALGSHKRIHKVKKAKPSLEEVLAQIADRLNNPRGGESNLYTCPTCGSRLELMPNSPGIYELKCKICYEGGSNMENREQRSQANPRAPKLELPPEIKELCEQVPLICEKLDELCELQGEIAEFLAEQKAEQK